MDLNNLIELLKEEGLDLAEDAAATVCRVVLDWLEKEVVASENKYDDLLLAVLPVVKAELFKLIDKINGEDDLPEAVK